MSLSVPRTLQVPSPTEGRTQPSGQGLDYLRPANADFSPLIRGVSALGNALEAQQAQQNAEGERLQKFKSLEQYNQFQTETGLKNQDIYNNSDLSDHTLTEKIAQSYKMQEDQFIAKLPPTLQEEFRARASDYKQQVILGAAAEQQKRLATYGQTVIEDQTTKEKTALDNNPAYLETAKKRIGELVDNAPGLTAAQRFEQKRLYNEQLEGMAWRDQKKVELQGHVGGYGGAAQLIAKREGFREAAYRDSNGQPVIGFGSTTITHPDGTVTPVHFGDVISKEDALRDLTRRTAAFASTARDALGNAWDKLSPGGRAAITSMTYNYGHVPDSVVAAARSGDPHMIAEAVRGLGGHNHGINRGRRNQEAALIEQSAPQGLLAPGNIDLNSRPVVHNPDGSISTVKSFSFEENGQEILVPQIAPDGRTMTEQEAIDLYHQTGQHLGKFKDAASANAYAEGLHNEQDLQYSNKSTMDNDPRFSNLPYEARVAYTNQAIADVNADTTAQAKAAKDAQAAMDNQALVNLHNGVWGQGDWEHYQSQHPAMDIDLITKGDGILKKRGEDVNLVAAATTRINDPTGDRNPGNPEIVKQNNALVGQAGIEKLNKQDKEYFTHEFMSNVNKMQDIPTDALGSIEGQVRSTDVTRANNAFDMLAQLQVNQPIAFDARAGQTIKDKLEIWKNNKDSMPPDQLMNKINPQGDPEFLRTRELADKAAEKALTDLKLNTAKDLPSMFWDTIAGPLRRGIPPPAGIEFASQAFYSDFKEGYKDGYFMSGGNEDQAMAMGTARVQANWGLGTNGHYIMKYPPDERRGYKQFDGSFSWQDDQLHKELGLPVDVQTQLVSDRQTEQEVQNFKAGGPPPSYLVYYKRNDGNWDFKADEQGKYRIRFEPSRALLTNETALFAVSNLKAQFEKFRTEVYNPISSAPSFGGMGVVPQKSVPPDIQQEYDSYVQRIGAAEKNLEGTRARVDTERYTFKPSVLPSEGSTPIDQPPSLY